MAFRSLDMCRKDYATELFAYSHPLSPCNCSLVCQAKWRAGRGEMHMVLSKSFPLRICSYMPIAIIILICSWAALRSAFKIHISLKLLHRAFTSSLCMERIQQLWSASQICLLKQCVYDSFVSELQINEKLSHVTSALVSILINAATTSLIQLNCHGTRED